jgi:hypothetical protein
VLNLLFHIVVRFGPGESSSEDAVMMNTPVVKSALEMGFSRSLVKQTVQSKILTTGENYKTVNDIVSALLNAEDERREEEKERQAEETASGILEYWLPTLFLSIGLSHVIGQDPCLISLTASDSPIPLPSHS